MVFLKSEAAKPIDPFSFPLNIFSLGQIRPRITASYTPWLRKLVGDIDLAYLTGFYRFDDLQAISASFTYFSMGKVNLMAADNTFLQEAHPNEWALDVAYSRKLHEYVSMAATLRFMYSDLNNGINSSAGQGVEEMYPAWTFAACTIANRLSCRWAPVILLSVSTSRTSAVR